MYKRVERVENGVMVIKDGKAWAVLYEDGRERNEGWTSIDRGELYDGSRVNKPLDVVWSGSHYRSALEGASVVHAKRTTTTEFIT